jgi:hypothetical protein
MEYGSIEVLFLGHFRCCFARDGSLTFSAAIPRRGIFHHLAELPRTFAYVFAALSNRAGRTSAHAGSTLETIIKAVAILAHIRFKRQVRHNTG